MEVSRFSYATQRSYFSHYVLEAIRGGADENEDGFVDLNELFRFVRDGVHTAVEQEAGSDEHQTPVLYQGGGAVVDDPPAYKLFSVSRSAQVAVSAGIRPFLLASALAETTASKPSPKQSPEGKTQPPKTPATQPSEKPPEKSTETPEKSAEEAARAAAIQKAEAKDPVDALLRKAWQRRDAMQSRTGQDAWTPVDYAPSVWREYQETLLGFEIRYRYGIHLTALQRETLRQLAGDVGAESDSILGRLAEARRQFVDSTTAAEFQNAPKELEPLDRAVKRRNDLLLSAPWYVRWCGQSRILSPGSPVPQKDIQSLLNALSELSARLEALELANRPADAAPANDEIAQIRTLEERLENLRATIDEVLKKPAREIIKQPGQKGATGKMESLLATPLLDCTQRMQLLDKLRDRGTLPAEARPARGSDREVRWEPFAEQCKLEWQLARLADPTLPEKPEPSEPRRIEDFVRIGKRLHDFYSDAPGRVNQWIGSGDPANARRARALLRVVDDHYGKTAINDNFISKGIPEIAWKQLIPRRLIVDDGAPGERTLALSREARWTQFEVKVAVLPREAADLSVKFNYDSSRVEMKDGERRLKGQPDAWETVSLDSEGRRVLHLEARPREAVPWRDGALDVEFRGNGVTASRTMRLTLAAPDQVDLVVQRIVDAAGPVRWEPDAARGSQPSTVRARAFPNRTTDFTLALSNRSRKPREVTVRLFASARSPGLDGSHRSDPLDSLGQVRGAYEPLTEPLKLSLSAAEDLQPIPLPEPKPPEKPEKKEETGPAASTPSDAEGRKKEKLPQGKDVSNGIACVIQDTASGKRWLHWIDFRAVSPAEYVVPTITYRHEEHQIDLGARLASDPRFLPPISDKEPVTVAWEVVELADPSLRKRPARALTLTLARSEGHSFVEAPPEGDRTLRIFAAIDGWPRAFIYDLECRPGAEAQSKGSLKQVTIVSPRPNTAFKSPFPRGTGLPLALQVDAPHEAFDTEVAGNQVEVWLDSERDPGLRDFRQRYRSDRQAIFRLEKLAPGGLMKIQTEARDYQIELDSQGATDTVATIHAKLVLPNLSMPGDKLEDRVPVYLDGQPPEIRMELARQIPLGSDLPVGLSTEELSGIQKIEYRFDRDEFGREIEGQKFAEVSGRIAQGRLEFNVPTKDVKEFAPGQTYYLRLRAVDRVGFSSEQSAAFTVLPPVVSPAKIEKQKVGAIRGQIYFRQLGNRADWGYGAVVQVEGPAQRTVTSDANGDFTIPGLPYGDYKIKISGTAANESGYSGSGQVKLDRNQVPVEIVATKK